MNQLLLQPPAGTLVDVPAPVDAQDRTREPPLRQYLRILLRRRRVIIGTVLAALAIGVIVTLLTPPKYTATATIEVARESNRVLGVQDAERESNQADAEFYQTQYGLLRSRTLAETVAKQLKVQDDPAFFETFSSRVAADLFPSGAGTRPTPQQRDRRLRAATDLLLENLRVDPVRLSRLVRISFESKNAALSARVANAWGDAFIATTLQRRYESNSYARKFLEDRIEQLRQRLEGSERALVSYAQNQQIINLPTQSSGTGGATAERSLLAESLIALNSELAQATADRIKAESRARDGANTPEGLQNSAISGLRQRRAELQGEYRKLLTQFEPAYPPARALQAQIAQLDAAIGREEQRVSSSITNNYAEAARRESELQARVNSLKDQALDLRRRSIQYNFYQRDLDTNRQLYDALLQRYKEIGVAGGVGTNNISVVDAAEVPGSKSSPRLSLNLLIALALGLLAAAAIALALEQTDETISDPSDINRLLSLPLLGAIPKTADRSPLEALIDRKSELVEAYLSVQTNLEFLTEHGTPRSLAVTSTRPSEGKSTTALAIANSLARAKRRVILVDSDMRKPSLHKSLGEPNEAGLSNFLAGNDAIAALVHPPRELGFSYMFAGPQPPNAAELLTGDRLTELIAQLLKDFDHVVVDSPPVMGLADALLIGSKVEGVLFAIESQSVRSSLVRLALNRLRAANVRLFGAVMTKYEARRAHYGYGYEYGYGYGREREGRAAA